jgi:solute carrier family 25 S-adenosylmethionine transporter 26
MSGTTNFGISLISGSLAGLCVDVVLYPLDTIKTRLQSAPGFLLSGGFHGIYRGLGSVAVGSVPGAALFFSTYDFVKHLVSPQLSSRWQLISPMIASCCGETVACLVRVPTEVVKQRTMTSRHLSSFGVLTQTLQAEGFGGLYRGYLVTLSRELPFSIIQFPLWEYLKMRWAIHQKAPVMPWQSSLCGAVAGGIAAALTTPLDVAKTRIMLAATGTDLARGNIVTALLTVFHQKGLTGLYAGVIPRTLWISLGGAIFLGMYDAVRLAMTYVFLPST